MPLSFLRDAFREIARNNVFSELITEFSRGKKGLVGTSSGAECVDVAEYYRRPFYVPRTENRTNDEIEQRMGKHSSAAFDVEANQINLRSRNSEGKEGSLTNPVTRVFQYLACRIRRLIRYSLVSPTAVCSKKEFTPLRQIYRILRCCV